MTYSDICRQQVRAVRFKPDWFRKHHAANLSMSPSVDLRISPERCIRSCNLLLILFLILDLTSAHTTAVSIARVCAC